MDRKARSGSLDQPSTGGGARRAFSSRCAVLVLAVTTLAVTAGPAPGHEAHRKANAESSAVQADAHPALAGDSLSAAATTPHTRDPGSAAGSDTFEMPPLTDLMMEHLHNKLVHFPIALGVAAAVLLWFARVRPGVDIAARILLWGAVLAAIAAYFTGRAQVGPFEGDAKEWVVRQHASLGTVTAVLMLLWGISTLFKPTRKMAAWIGLVVVGLVLTTAMYGGLVAHG